MPPALFFVFRIALAILGLLWFHINFRIMCSISAQPTLKERGVMLYLLERKCYISYLELFCLRDLSTFSHLFIY